MSNEFYKFIAKQLFAFFQQLAINHSLQEAESFYLKVDDADMITDVNKALKDLLINEHCIGSFDMDCMNGSKYSTYTINVNNHEIIVAAQENGMTNDFLGATLRNTAKSCNMPLLMITDNPIDSAISGSLNLAAAGMPFYYENLLRQIKVMVKNNVTLNSYEKRILENEIDNHEADVFSDKSSLYEYSEFFSIISRGEIKENEYPDFGLFKIENTVSLPEKQIKELIKRNSKLFNKIDNSMRFGKDLSEELSEDFDDVFIKRIEKSKKDKDHWSIGITFEEVEKASAKKQKQKGNPLKIDNDQITVFDDILLNQLEEEKDFYVRDDTAHKKKLPKRRKRKY